MIFSQVSLLLFQKKPGNSNGAALELQGSCGLVQWLKQIGEGRETKHSAESDRIIENDGQGSYAQFGFPLCGLPTSENEIAWHSRGRRASVAAAHVPDVLPIQLPTGGGVPLEASSPKSKWKAGLPRSSANGVSELAVPQLEESRTKNATPALSPGVKDLLSKIPDVSFMLESKLVLTEK